MKTANHIDIKKIYEQNLNFLVGSGASFGLFPTLELQLGKNLGENHTIETLAKAFEDSADETLKTLLFMHYYKTCIKPVMDFDIEADTGDDVKENAKRNYQKFLETILLILPKKKDFERKCNLFTTNYDGCLPFAADKILQAGLVDFHINDGTKGFRRKQLNVQNYDSIACQTGIFDRHRVSIPQINIINIHGSAYWRKLDDSTILVDYATKNSLTGISDELLAACNEFSKELNNPDSSDLLLPGANLPKANQDAFWSAYKKLPIVNPTKWKFHETVFEEHYYQLLRMLSYELEKTNSTLITFGFSFADEHIRNLVKRSLTNPTLQVYICCFNAAELERMKKHFRSYDNICCIYLEDGNLGFTEFNEKAFTLSPKEDVKPVGEA